MIRLLAILSVSLTPFSFAKAQAPTLSPVPAQFISDTTMFLGNGGAKVSGHEKEAAVMLWTSAIREIGSHSGYQLVGSPDQAQLFAEISLQTTTQVVNGGSLEAGYLRLAVFDAKSRALLWTFDEGVQGAFRKGSFVKNLDDAAARLSSDLKAMASGKLP